MRILALDLGRKRIGVAVSDELCLVARTLTTLKPVAATPTRRLLLRWWPSRTPSG